MRLEKAHVISYVIPGAQVYFLSTKITDVCL